MQQPSLSSPPILHCFVVFSYSHLLLPLSIRLPEVRSEAVVRLPLFVFDQSSFAPVGPSFEPLSAFGAGGNAILPGIDLVGNLRGCNRKVRRSATDRANPRGPKLDLRSPASVGLGDHNRRHALIRRSCFSGAKQKINARYANIRRSVRDSGDPSPSFLRPWPGPAATPEDFPSGNARAPLAATLVGCPLTSERRLPLPLFESSAAPADPALPPACPLRLPAPTARITCASSSDGGRSSKVAHAFRVFFAARGRAKVAEA